MDMGEVRIRTGEVGDIDAFVGRAMELANTERALGHKGYVDSAREFVKCTVAMFDAMVKSDRFVLLVAEIDGKEVGVVVGEIQRLERMHKHALQGVILVMVVDEEYRGSRVGVRLLGAIETAMSEVGVSKMVADVYQWNEPPQWGLSKYGYEYEYVRLSRVIGG